MKTQTQVGIKLNSLQPFENLRIEPEGYVLKFFMGCSEIDSQPFKIKDFDFTIDQRLKIKNILGNQLEIWLCTTEDKIIANATTTLINQGEQQSEIELKLNGILFAKLSCSLTIIKRAIQKMVFVEPDENLLKKEQDPQSARLKEEQQKRRLKEQQEQQKLALKQKKHLITLSYRNKKDEPFM